MRRLKRYTPPRPRLLESARRVMLDLSDLSGDETPVSLSEFVRANREPGVVPLSTREVNRMRRLRPGEAIGLPIGGGWARVRRTRRG